MPKKGYTVMTGIKRHTFAGLLTAGLLTGITAIVTAAELTSLERMERAAGAEAFRKAMAAKEKDNAAYLNNLRIAVDKGTPAAILEDADRLLLRAGGRVNNYDMIRQRLERLSRQIQDGFHGIFRFVRSVRLGSRGYGLGGRKSPYRRT